MSNNDKSNLEEIIDYGPEAAKLPTTVTELGHILVEGMVPPPAPPLKFRARVKGGWKTPKSIFYRPKKSQLDALNLIFDENYPFIQPYLRNAHREVGDIKHHLKAPMTKDNFLKHYNNHAEQIDVKKKGLSEMVKIGGFCDKRNGIVYLNPEPFTEAGPQIGIAIHECIHLLSHPPGKGKKSTFEITFLIKLYEGVTQYFTEFILSYQKFKNWQDHRGHENETYYAEMLIGWLGPQADEIMAKAYFLGENNQLLNAMKKIFGKTAEGDDITDAWHQKIREKKLEEAFKLLRDPWRI